MDTQKEREKIHNLIFFISAFLLEFAFDVMTFLSI